LTYALYLARTRAYDLAQICLNEGLLADVDIQSLISNLDPSSQCQVSAEEQTALISSSLDITPELLDLTLDDLKAITNYLSVCKLMIDCSKQASGISAQKWEAIKQRMFLPKPAE
ncbi:NACHT C-terminal helical domain 2-containing protein, partial [Acaryochloris marina NIES-2412]|uniref:NACHT C-terminal helical domain 2-containing protein n=1 Tax=Acaryochloris marina TaxID=155978 RepID=UPI0040591AFC